MLLSNIPAWFAKRFGQDATGSYIRSIPATTADPAAASMSLGFPPQTFVDEGAGGTPPDGRDFNGILNYLSAWAQWQGAGGTVPWNSTIASNGGYPNRAIVGSNNTPGLTWRSTADNNTTNPDAGGAGWVLQDNLVGNSLVANLGFRSWASGFKECWGRVTVAANSQTTVTMPITHTSFLIPTIAVQLGLNPGDPVLVGIAPVGTNTFDIINNDIVSRIVNWHTVGG